MTAVTRAFARSTASVPAARHFVVEMLAELPAESKDVTAVLVSELATNALVYGGGGFEVTVSYARATRCVRVEVCNEGSGQPMVQHPDDAAEHGRGLRLVAALSTRWGVESAVHARMNVVWFEVAVPAGGTATAGS